jgi:hypothetical protein
VEIPVPESSSTHFSEKPAPPPPEHGVGLSFSAFSFGMPEQKVWVSLEPEPPKLQTALGSGTKKEEASVSPFEVAGSWPKELGPKFPKCFSQRPFGRQIFPGRDSAAHLFAPAFVWAETAGP